MCVGVYTFVCVLCRNVLVVSRYHVVVCFDYTSYLKTLIYIYIYIYILQSSFLKLASSA